MSRSWSQPTKSLGKSPTASVGTWVGASSLRQTGKPLAQVSKICCCPTSGMAPCRAALPGCERTPRKEGTGLVLAPHSSTTSYDLHSASRGRGLAKSPAVHHLHPAWRKLFIPGIGGGLSVDFDLQHLYAYFWATHSPAQPRAAAFSYPSPGRTQGCTVHGKDSVLLAGFTSGSRTTPISEPRQSQKPALQKSKGQTT